ncbi:hypothetical protein LIA77_08069 [Sarocladium implicatum]|nr:hypothetical protein LIA77_08069 [Sarocladium implicatum]
MAEPTKADWLKYYVAYAWVKVKLTGQYAFALCCLPCTCCMSAMATDSPFWTLPRRPDEADEERRRQRSEEDGNHGREAV